MPVRISELRQLLDAIAKSRERLQGRAVLVAIDGFGGSGKSTLAARIGRCLPGAAVVHTDDFALGWQFGWDWDRYQAHILQPLRAGHAGRYQRYDWGQRQLAEWREVPADTATLILEGVSSTRRELGERADVTVWVEAPAALRLRRGLERDGEDARHLWEQWMAEEEAWAAEQSPADRCDFLVDGAAPLPPGLGG